MAQTASSDFLRHVAARSMVEAEPLSKKEMQKMSISSHMFDRPGLPHAQREALPTTGPAAEIIAILDVLDDLTKTMDAFEQVAPYLVPECLGVVAGIMHDAKS